MSELVFWGIEHNENSKNKKHKVGFGSIYAIYGIKAWNVEKMKKIPIFVSFMFGPVWRRPLTIHP